MLSVWFMGIGTKHAHKEYVKPAVRPDVWLLMQFSTDFVYRIKGEKGFRAGKAHQCIIMPPGKITRHGPAAKMEEGFINDWIYIYRDEVSEIISSLNLPIETAFSVVKSGLLAPYIQKLIKEEKAPEYERQYIQSAVCTEMLIELSRSHKAYHEKFNPKVAILDRVRARMLSDYKSDWTLDKLAKLSGYSPSRFAALYKQSYGVSPINELITYRIGTAQRLLYEGKLSVTEISSEVGFSSLHYFSYYFKKITGFTPSSFCSSN